MEWWVLPMLGGWLAVDQTSFGQFMVSRPLVGGTLTGWILGEPMLGFLLGGAIELCCLPAVPAGGGEVPEGGPAAVVGVWVGCSMGEAGGLALGVAVGLFWAWLGSVSVHFLRTWNCRWVPDSAAGGGVTSHMVRRGQLLGLALDFLRGAVLTVGGMAAAVGVFPLLQGSWPLGKPATLALLAAGVSLSMGGLLGLWAKRGKRWWIFLTGCSLGMVWGVLA